MENVRDWNISRQLYWGHQIPAWFYGAGANDYVVAANAQEALALAKEKSGLALVETDLSQDPDVLDTWFSSWLWPISVFDGIRHPDNNELTYYYPTKALVTAPEILFFWVARMVMAGYEYTGKKPFEAVYLTGIVRDKQGRKMSKSLGNSPDPLHLIEKYGADGVRVGMLLSSPAGNDLLFDEDLCKQGSFFANKVWNAMRLVKMWQVDEATPQPEYAQLAGKWFASRLSQATTELNDSLDKYRMSEALMTVYRLVWDDFCSWYLEMVKPDYGMPIDAATYNQTLSFFEDLLVCMHPFMPFITEEIWHVLRERSEGATIMFEKWISSRESSDEILGQFAFFEESLTALRTLRKEKNIAQREPIEAFVVAGANYTSAFEGLLKRMGNLSSLQSINAEVAGAQSFRVGATVYYVPLSGQVNVEEEVSRLQKELEYNQGFLNSVLSKLANERFVNSAPAAVVEVERKKQADAEAKIVAITERLKALGA
jgi:valyl-tRNA synthetase